MDDTEATKILKRDALGRVTLTGEQREALLDEFERSGLKGKPFARLAGVNYPTFASWIQKRRHARGDYARASRGQAAAGGKLPRALSWMEAVLASPHPAASGPLGGTGAAALELHLPGGAHLTIATPQQAALAAQLLKALTQSASC
ncbi:MAG: hypothetical protein B7Z47_07825 [Chthoniobacter sp. 12-60-6]|nr:MAG: hypothetical protein B7Z47_07825 [Chthoniobacter sp. 12-60-6]